MPALAQPAAQQPGRDEQVQEVVVTGIRASLEKSLDVKKESLGVVDAISSEDIGKFPDANLADALQRIPGVTINRGTSSSGGVPSSMGNGTEITVRGFGPAFNETLFDGRRVASAIVSNSNTSGDRGFDFSSVGADFVSQVDIRKTPDSSLSAGAIGATVDIHFPKPFDHPGLQLALSGAENVSDTSGHPTPVGGFLVSDTFADETFGFLVDAHYKDTQNETNHINIQGWEGATGATGLKPCQLKGAVACNPDLHDANNTGSITDWFIQDYGIYKEYNEDRRVDARAVLQWRPTSSVLVTVNDDYSKDTFTQNQYAYTVWFNNGSLADVTQAPDGTVTSFVQPNSPTDFQSEVNGSVIQNNLFGLNVRWEATEHTSFILDAAQSVSKLNPGGEMSNFDVDVGYGPSSTGGTNGGNIGIVTGAAGSLPYPINYGPNGNAAQFLGSGIIGSHVVPMVSPRNTDTINQFKLEGQWHGDAHRLALRYGVQYVQDTQSRSSLDSLTNNDWQAYAGYGPQSNNPGGVTLPQQWFTGSYSTANFIPGFGNGGQLPPQILRFDPYAVLAHLQGLGNPQTTTIPGFNDVPAYSGVYEMAENAGSHAHIVEKDISPYVSFAAQFHLGGMRLDVNAGVRDENTRLSTQGLGLIPSALTIQTSDHTAYVVSYTSATPTPVEQSNRYNYVLPNLDLGLWVMDDFRLRFDTSRSLTRPPLGYLTPVLNVASAERVGSLVANGGNPDLLPFTSTNFDLGAEWYYSRNSYVSVGAFLKNVSNFIVGGTTLQSINNVVLPDTGAVAQFAVTKQFNGPSAQVRGVELAWQHTFGETGFGYQANATFVGTDRSYDPNDTGTSGFAITGLANSANFVGFYDRDGFQARVAVNWRGEYLDHFGQAQNNSQFGSEPTFVNANTEVDFSTSYDFNPSFSVFFEAANLNNSTYSTHGRFKEQLLDAIDFGRSYTLGVRAKL